MQYLLNVLHGYLALINEFWGQIAKPNWVSVYCMYLTSPSILTFVSVPEDTKKDQVEPLNGEFYKFGQLSICTLLFNIHFHFFSLLFKRKGKGRGKNMCGGRVGERGSVFDKKK